MKQKASEANLNKMKTIFQIKKQQITTATAAAAAAATHHHTAQATQYREVGNIVFPHS